MTDEEIVALFEHLQEQIVTLETTFADILEGMTRRLSQQDGEIEHLRQAHNRRADLGTTINVTKE